MSQAQVSRKRKPEIEINPPNPEKKRKFSKPQSSKTEFKPRDDNIELDFPETDHKSMILISQLNKLGSKLLKKKDEDEINKTIIIDKILTKIGSLLHKLIHKKSASKFVQACYKYGNEKQRTLIFKLLNQGDLSEVFKSKYGHFVLLKVLKKCDKDQKNKIFEEICKNIYVYCSHSESAKIIESFIKIATPHQITHIKSLYSQEKLKNTEKLENIAMRIIDKSLTNYHISQYVLGRAFPILIPVEKEKVIDKFKENIVDLGRTKEGLTLAISIINNSNNKQKKIMVKGLKEKVMTIVKDTSKAYLVMIKLIHSVDDREILAKFVLKEIKNNMIEVLTHPNGLNLISSLLMSNNNILQKLEVNGEVTTCKKDENTRREEIFSIIIDDLIKAFQSNLKDYVINLTTSRIISHIMEKILTNENYFNENSKKFIEKIFSLFIDDVNDIEESLICHIDGNRILKNLIKLSPTVVREAKDFIDEKVEKVVEIVDSNLQIFIKKRAIFIIISIIENTSYNQMIIDKLKKIKNKLPKDQPGVEILLNLIK